MRFLSWFNVTENLITIIVPLQWTEWDKLLPWCLVESGSGAIDLNHRALNSTKWKLRVFHICVSSHAPWYSNTFFICQKRDLVLDLCPKDYCMLISCMLHLYRTKWSTRWRKSGSNASTSTQCITHSILFIHFCAISFTPSQGKHFIRSRTPIFLGDCPLCTDFLFLTSATHLIIHEMQ